MWGILRGRPQLSARRLREMMISASIEKGTAASCTVLPVAVAFESEEPTELLGTPQINAVMLLAIGSSEIPLYSFDEIVMRLPGAGIRVDKEHPYCVIVNVLKDDLDVTAAPGTYELFVRASFYEKDVHGQPRPIECNCNVTVVLDQDGQWTTSSRSV
jgi:hypothetical protein